VLKSSRFSLLSNIAFSFSTKAFSSAAYVFCTGKIAAVALAIARAKTNLLFFFMISS